MKTQVLTILCLLAGFVSLPVVAQSPRAEWPANEAARYASIRQEILHAIHKGNSYLKSKQASDGTWGETAYPAMTALPVTAAMRAPGQIGKPVPEYLKKSYEFIWHFIFLILVITDSLLIQELILLLFLTQVELKTSPILLLEQKKEFQQKQVKKFQQLFYLHQMKKRKLFTTS